MGRTAFEEEKAEKLAAMGYVGFVVDIFGADVRPTNFDEAGAAMQVLNAVPAVCEAAPGFATMATLPLVRSVTGFGNG